MDERERAGRRRGPLLVFLGAALWSTNAPFFKLLHVDAYLAVCLRSAFAGLALLPALRWRQVRWDRHLLLMLLAYTGLCTGVVLAIGSTSANIAVGMQYTAPVWLFLLEKWRKRFPFSLRKHWPVAVLFAGLVVSMCSGSSAVTARGNLIALSTGIFFAGMTLASKRCAADNPLGMVALTNLFCALVVLVCFVPRPVLAQLRAVTPLEWGILFFLGVFQIGAGYAFYYLGLRTTEPAEASMIAPCEMVLGPIWVAVFLHEYPDWIGVLGSLLVVAGAVGEVVVRQREVSVGGAPAGD